MAHTNLGGPLWFFLVFHDFEIQVILCDILLCDLKILVKKLTEKKNNPEKSSGKSTFRPSPKVSDKKKIYIFFS